MAHTTDTDTSHKAITVRHSNRCAICGRLTVKVNGQRVHKHEVAAQ